MTSQQKIKEVFSIFHDGSISAWELKDGQLNLTINCLYLAERISDNFEVFYLQLNNIEKLEFAIWPDQEDSTPPTILTDPKVFFDTDLEILSGKLNDDCIEVSCAQHDTTAGYPGGELRLKADNIVVFDQDRNEIPFEQLDELCTAYWKAWKEHWDNYKKEQDSKKEGENKKS
ncbi:MAG: hypothetical protein MI810_09150 [Flavobacteriales bacterium]|nr:hypothetical protein [Flavobacteriales bacterium]